MTVRVAGAALCCALALALPSAARATLDIDALWEYGDPAASEARFRAALPSTNRDERLELLTQIARTHSLRRQFDAANRLLDSVATELKDAGARPRVRYLLERGRTLNSSGARERARPLFSDAWDIARTAGLDGLAVDAAHMVAITHGGTEAALDWTRKGLALARTSTDKKAHALVPALLNNAAWDLHDMGRYADALPLFEQALIEWTARGRPAQIHSARWSVARCLRSLGRSEEALATQLALERESAARDSVDGYVLEEIAELYDSLGRASEARAYFARAAQALGKDADFAGNHPERLARLRARAQ